MIKIIFRSSTLYLGVLLFSWFLVTSQVNAQEPFDRYKTFISWGFERANLDNFAIYLTRFPETIGYIAFYTGDDHSLNQTRKRINLAKNYLVSRRKIGASRIKIIYVGRLGKFATTILQPLDKDLPPPYKDVGRHQ